MYCPNCGTLVDDSASFCTTCGRRMPISKDVWEICEIRVVKAEGMNGILGGYRYQAIVKNPQGEIIVEVSRPFVADTYKDGNKRIIKSDRIHQTLLDGFTKKLIQVGWQPIENGQYWYSYRFKRQLP
jgi:hypothetical protein